MSEAEYLESQGDYGAAEHCREHDRARKLRQMQTDYDDAKRAETGATIRCPGCRRLFVKKTYNKVFCNNQRTTGKGINSCKDYYWNTMNPRGMAMRAHD